MLALLLRGTLTVLLAGALPLAHADIYTWTDESGRVNISNVTPPEGVRVTKVARESPAQVAAREEARREALREAEVRVLAERVRQLQDEVDFAKRQPPQVEYRVMPAPSPPIIQYISMPAPQYAAPDPPPVTSNTCGLGWPDCTFGWYPGFYPVSVAVPRAPHFRRNAPAPLPSRGHIAPWLPITVPGSGRGH